MSNEAEPGMIYPNSPPPPDTKKSEPQPIRQAPEAEPGLHYDKSPLGSEVVELRGEPQYGFSQAISLRIADLPLHIIKCCESSAYKGGDAVLKTLSHYVATLDGVDVFDHGIVSELKSLAREMSTKTGGTKLDFFNGQVRPFLLELSVVKKG